MVAARAMLLVFGTALPGTAPLAGDRPSLQLQIDPTLCVLDQGQNHCPVPLRVSWQSPPLDDALCLYRIGTRRPLHCQYEAGGVALELSEPLAETSRFELRALASQQVLASVEVTVARPLAELRPRRRHGWGMF